MAQQDQAHVLFSLGGVKAYHIQNGEETSLNASGPQTLSLLMVPTNTSGPSTSSEQDFYLHLTLPPELELPLPATTQIYHQPPSSFLIPRWDLSPDSGAFTRIEFPPVGKGPGTITQEDVDTFETILAQCTAFMERATPPGPSLPGYNPAAYEKGKAYGEKTGNHGQVVLIDEENGSVVGELAEGALVVEDPQLAAGRKDPVEVIVSADGKRVDVRPVSEDYLELASMPQYQKSSLVQNAAAASRLIVTGSSYLGNMMTTGADKFVSGTKPNPKPLEFKPATHARVRQIHNFTHGAHGLSQKTVGSVSRYAQNIGAGITGRGQKQPKLDKDGNAAQAKPGLLNKSMIAFSTIADGIAYSGKQLLNQSAGAASTMVSHRYGQEAGSLTADLAGGVKNVGLVYIDVTGVSRRAVIGSVAKGMVVGKMKDGKQIVVGGGDGGEVSSSDLKAAEAAQQQAAASGKFDAPPSQQGAQEYGRVGAAGTSSVSNGGAAPPPAYTQDYYGAGVSGPPAGEKGTQYRY